MTLDEMLKSDGIFCIIVPIGAAFVEVRGDKCWQLTPETFERDGELSIDKWNRDVPMTFVGPLERKNQKPIDMVLYCPRCHTKHVDAPEPGQVWASDASTEYVAWTNPPHKTHRCKHCQYEWRPAHVPTNGVEELPRMT